jgi:hypothetical protein
MNRDHDQLLVPTVQSSTLHWPLLNVYPSVQASKEIMYNSSAMKAHNQ